MIMLTMSDQGHRCGEQALVVGGEGVRRETEFPGRDDEVLHGAAPPGHAARREDRLLVPAHVSGLQDRRKSGGAAPWIEPLPLGNAHRGPPLMVTRAGRGMLHPERTGIMVVATQGSAPVRQYRKFRLRLL